MPTRVTAVQTGVGTFEINFRAHFGLSPSSWYRVDTRTNRLLYEADFCPGN